MVGENLLLQLLAKHKQTRAGGKGEGLKGVWLGWGSGVQDEASLYYQRCTGSLLGFIPPPLRTPTETPPAPDGDSSGPRRRLLQIQHRLSSSRCLRALL